MKSKILLGVVAVTFLFIQQVAAQEVNRILQDKEKRQMLYSSIINNDERFNEFLEAAKTSGRMVGEEVDEEEVPVEPVLVVTDASVEEHPAVTGVHESYERQEMMDQMVILMKELVEKDPEFQKVINERCPGMGKAMRKE